jgi:hypothetical protein
MTMTNKVLNDSVEAVHLRLLEDDDDYRALLGAVRNEHAVEGSLADDDIMAAMKIRERAAKDGKLGHYQVPAYAGSSQRDATVRCEYSVRFRSDAGVVGAH